jgi:hypothetical protein
MKHVAGTFECNSWDEFIKKLSELEEATAGARTSEPLFRGQPNADWGLVTSLERETSELMTLERYHEHYVTPAFNALSGFH